MAKTARRRWDEAKSAAANARERLPGMAGAYFENGRKRLGEATTAADLHAFRLKSKRLRYTLELFRACYGPGLERHLEGLKKVQTFLGDINDCAVALRLAAAKLPKNSREYQKVERFLNARLARLTAGFRRHWREEFDAAGREEAWVGYLGRRPRGRG